MGVNEEHIERFISERKAGGAKPETVKKYRTNLHQFSRVVGKDFEKWDKQDIIKALAWLNDQSFCPVARGKKKAHLTAFFKWLKGCEGRNYPPEVSWFTCSPLLGFI